MEIVWKSSQGGYDAARALALADLFYHRVQKGMLLALPEPDLLIFQDWPGAAGELESFSSHAQQACSGSANPLSPQVFTIDSGRMVAVQP